MVSISNRFDFGHLLFDLPRDSMNKLTHKSIEMSSTRSLKVVNGSKLRVRVILLLITCSMYKIDWEFPSYRYLLPFLTCSYHIWLNNLAIAEKTKLKLHTIIISDNLDT